MDFLPQRATVRSRLLSLGCTALLAVFCSVPNVTADDLTIPAGVTSPTAGDPVENLRGLTAATETVRAGLSTLRTLPADAPAADRARAVAQALDGLRSFLEISGLSYDELLLLIDADGGIDRDETAKARVAPLDFDGSPTDEPDFDGKGNDQFRVLEP